MSRGGTREHSGYKHDDLAQDGTTPLVGWCVRAHSQHGQPDGEPLLHFRRHCPAGTDAGTVRMPELIEDVWTLYRQLPQSMGTSW